MRSDRYQISGKMHEFYVGFSRHASRQLAALHRYPSATRQLFNNQSYQTNYVQGNYIWNKHNCLNLFLKVQHDDKMHKSPESLPSINGSVTIKVLRMCGIIW